MIVEVACQIGGHVSRVHQIESETGDGGQAEMDDKDPSQFHPPPPWTTDSRPKCVCVYFFDHFYFPAQLVGGFTLSDLLDKPWSQVSSLLPHGTRLQFLSRTGFSIPNE